MNEPAPSTIEVSADVTRFSRYRWAVFEDGKLCDQSLNNFATRREARADAEKFVEKLMITWHKRK